MVGAASGGVWKSLDGGTTFIPVFDDQPVQSIGAGEIEFSTDSADIVSYLVERAPLAPPCEVSEEEFHLVNVTDRTCTVMGG